MKKTALTTAAGLGLTALVWLLGADPAMAATAGRFGRF